MALSEVDQEFSRRALALAERAAAFASPNPTVGCVLAHDERVLAEGAHFYEAKDHAEIAALKAAARAGNDPRGATAYVTLEPCSHHGRTGPCADALIAAGITRCVVATVDPNPQVRGGGLRRLETAGVQVEVLAPDNALAQQARRLNDAFAFSIRSDRPWVTLKSAVSLDGKVAPPPETRTDAAPVWLTGPEARAEVQRLRHGSDALMTGIGTVLSDDPELTDRTGEPRRRPLLRVVLDCSLQISVSSALVQGAADDLLVMCDAEASARRQRALERFRLEVVRLPDLRSRGGLAQVLAQLQARQIRSVLLEAGPGLNTAMLQAGLVDKVVFFFADVELGQAAVPFALDGTSPYLLQQQLTGLQRRSFPHGDKEDVCLTGMLHEPWAGF